MWVVLYPNHQVVGVGGKKVFTHTWVVIVDADTGNIVMFLPVPQATSTLVCTASYEDGHWVHWEPPNGRPRPGRCP